MKEAKIVRREDIKKANDGSRPIPFIGGSITWFDAVRRTENTDVVPGPLHRQQQQRNARFGHLYT